MLHTTVVKGDVRPFSRRDTLLWISKVHLEKTSSSSVSGDESSVKLSSYYTVQHTVVMLKSDGGRAEHS